MPLVRICAPLGYLVAYLVAIVLGRLAVLEDSGLALFWPAAGVSALWMLRGTTRRQVALDVGLLFASSALLFLAFGAGPLGSLAFATANTVQGFVVRAVRAAWRGLPLTGPLAPGAVGTRDLLELMAAAFAASVLSSPLGMLGLWGTGEPVSWGTVIGWMIRNSCGAFVVAAVVLTVTTALRDRPRASLITAEPRPYAALELLAATTLTVISGVLVFTAPEQRPIAFVMIATTTWIGFRFSPLVGAVHTSVFGTVAILCALAGLGPFGAAGDLSRQAIAVQVFIVISATIVLMLAFGASERIALTTRLRASELVASERATLVDAVTSVMEDGLVVVDATGAVLLSNPAAEQMTGLSTGSPRVGSPQNHGLVNLDGSALSASELPSARALRGEVVPPTDLLRIHPMSGQQTILSVSGTRLHATTRDAPAVAVIVVRDVTKARAQQRELETFAGVVAHDLRAPLTGVISWAEILTEQLDDPAVAGAAELHASVERITGSAHRMADLIAVLLAYSQTQNAELSARPVSLDELVDQISADLGDNHRRPVPVLEHAPLGRVLADPTLVRQLLTNLVSNAVKYVAPGVVPHIVISAAPMDGMLEVWVSDNGIGIPEQDLGRVFDNFYRAPGTHHYPGTGLGLAICARTVERHGGRISARQGSGGTGTTMLFTLPLAPALPPGPGTRPDLEPLSAS